MAVAPSGQTGPAINFQAFKQEASVRLVWEIPERIRFPRKEIKDFIIFRAEVPEGVSPKDCDCEFLTIDFISPDSEPRPSLFQRLRNRLSGHAREHRKTYEYIDKKTREGISYVYKIVIMDRNNRMGKDSVTAFVDWTQPEPDKTEVTRPEAPTGLAALSTQESILLTWDEITDGGVVFYRVYRSEGGDFSVIGESVTPVFTDTNISPRKKYYYRVSAVSDDESPFSEHIEVVTDRK